MKTEMQRRKTKRDDLLKAFEREGELTTWEVMQIAGTGMSSRLKELKRKGHKILSQYQQPGEWLYVYLSGPESESI